MRRPGNAEASADGRRSRGAAKPRAARRSAESTRRVARPANLRERLLSCTTAIIRKDGLAFVSLRAVARRARVSHGAPAYHFRSKAGLLAAYAQQGYERLNAKVERLLKQGGGDPARELRLVGCGYIAFAIENPEHFAIMFRDEYHEHGNAGLDAAANRALGLLRGVLVRCVSKKRVRTDDFEALLAASWAVAHGHASLWLSGRTLKRFGGADPAKFAERVIGLFVDSIIADGK
jgi:AcrR family transcriptional regulator